MPQESQININKNRSNFFQRLLGFRELTLAFIVIGVSVILTIVSPYFFTTQNLSSVAINLSLNAIIAVGMVMILIAGGFDLSVGSVFGLSSVILVQLHLQGINNILAIIISLTAAALVGFVNGFLVTKVKVNPLITTLGMLSIARGFTYVVSQGQSKQTTFAEWFLYPGKASVFGVPVLFIIMVVIVVLGQFLLRKTTGLRQLYFVGSNETAARFSGIRVDKIRWISYISCSLLAGFAAILNISRFEVSVPTSGQGIELRVIAACIIGGLSLAGGEGSVIGAVLGIILLALVSNAMVLLNVPLYWQQVLSGSILILAVVADQLKNRRNLRS